VRKFIVGGALVAALAMPAGATADTTKADTKNAAKECKQLRKASGEENFRAMFGGKKNAFGKCVSKRAKENAAQREETKTNASKECKAERQADPAAFKAKYRNLGKCVSERARQKEEEQAAEEKQDDAAERNAARECKAERKSDEAAFAEKYGSRRNAFGKCVSQNSKDDEEEQAPQA
jgi:hypothetical protein